MYDHGRPDELRTARRLARLLDSQFKVFGIRFGLDPVLGLIPGLGDAIPLAYSAYLLTLAARLGLPRSALLAMTVNSALDAGLGLVPGLGDFTDIFFKANLRNIEIMERHLERMRREGKVIDSEGWEVRD